MLRVLLVTATLLACAPRVAAQALEDEVVIFNASFLTRAGLEERDRRLSFRRTSADRARAVLDAAPSDELARAVAVMALGSSGSARDLFRMESLAYDGRYVEKQAAILALGELGQAGDASLCRLFETDVRGVEETLVLALIHAAERGGRGCAELVREAQVGTGPLARAARLLEAYAAGGVASESIESLDVYYELRWLAAREYGFVDGRRWRRLLLERLCADEEFLDRVVLAAADGLDSPAVQDHLFEILHGEERDGPLRAVATLLADELAEAIDLGVWRPPTLEHWRILLAEIEDQRAEKQAIELLNLAFDSHIETQQLAGLLLLRAGEDVPWKWVAQQLSGAPEELRRAFVEAAGDRGDERLVPDLVALVFQRPDLGIFGSGIVALTRLDYDDARTELERQLKSPRSPERREVLLSLARAGHDRSMLTYIDEALRIEDLEPEVRFQLELSFAMQGRLANKAYLREWLARAQPHPLRRVVVRALARRATEEDLALLRELFPVEDDLDLNVELALALVRNRDQSALPVLRAALWNPSWNRSVLAGGLLAEAVSLFGLIDELQTPPAEARSADMRRVGFAIGEWGGLGAYERLRRTLTEGDEALQGAFLGMLCTRTH